MKKKSNKKSITKTNAIKKSLGALMKDEDGFVSKENILKVGLSTVAALGIVGALEKDSQALLGNGPGDNRTIHTNSVGINYGQRCATHTNNTDHYNY